MGGTGVSDLNNGDKVRVKLYGDSDLYYGTVIRSQKQWIRLDGYPVEGFIADENNIESIEAVEPTTDSILE